jgi:aromatic ring-opening dioxygenase catalytic subunit (LigB family)
MFRANAVAILAPVYFLSHGTAFLLQNDSRVRDYWRKIGRDALDNGCRGVIMMVVSPSSTHKIDIELISNRRHTGTSLVTTRSKLP